jgi:hypothetical protein
MKLRHFCAALLLVCGIGPQAYAEEQAKPEVQQEAQQQVQQIAGKDSGAPENKAAAAVRQSDASANSGVASAAVSPFANALSGNAGAKVYPAPMIVAQKDARWLDTFLYEVKVTDVLIALFAGLLVLLGWMQARRLRETVSAARDSAEVAGKSARLAQDALISGQRAFMFIREIRTYLNHDPATNMHQWSIHPIWENSGNTPTKGLSINTTYSLLNEPLPDDYDFPHAREDLIPTIAGPKTMVEAVSGVISTEDLAAIQNGTKYFYIWGWAEYHDIFEDTRKHVTRFCNQLTHVIGDTTVPIGEHNMVQMMFSFHTENNYAD